MSKPINNNSMNKRMLKVEKAIEDGGGNGGGEVDLTPVNERIDKIIKNFVPENDVDDAQIKDRNGTLSMSFDETYNRNLKPIAMHNNKIEGLAVGVNSADAVNKGQLDLLSAEITNLQDIINGLVPINVSMITHTDTRYTGSPFSLELTNYNIVGDERFIETSHFKVPEDFDLSIPLKFHLECNILKLSSGQLTVGLYDLAQTKNYALFTIDTTSNIVTYFNNSTPINSALLNHGDIIKVMLGYASNGTWELKANAKIKIEKV